MPPTPGQQPNVQINNQAPQKSGAGPIVGIVIIVILLVFGAFYFWGQRLNKEQNVQPPLVQGDIKLN